MASRPIFLPISTNFSPIREVPIEFTWHAGLSASQKQKSIASLHEAATKRLNLVQILEVSTKSLEDAGKRLSAFNLRVKLSDGSSTSVESAYQASKTFANGGPYQDLLHADSRVSKTDERLCNSGPMMRFEFEGTRWPLNPKTAFYDWLYINALSRNAELSKKVLEFDGFTDIEFNPERSFNCQARSVALFCSLTKAGTIHAVLKSPECFIDSYRKQPPSSDEGSLF